jgi:hypothetical protein
LRVDFFRLEREDLHPLFESSAAPPVSVLFSESTFETLLSWRTEGASIPGYAALDPEALHSLAHEHLPKKLGELKDCVRNMIFVEPQPDAGGAGAVFQACARYLPDFESSVWGFRPPFDHLFRLSPRSTARQTVYAFTRDVGLLDALRDYADPL